MARARIIKPGFFANDLLAEIPPLGRLLFQGLWCYADREGRLHDRPKRIKVEILPYDECDADALLSTLQDKGFIIRYSSGDDRFIQIVNFTKHQAPHVKESASLIPAYVEQSSKPELAPEIPVQVPVEPVASSPCYLLPSISLPSISLPSTDTPAVATAPLKFSDEDLEDAREMFSSIQRLNPNHKPPNFEGWAEAIRLIRERDNRTREEIRKLFHWANADPFWQGNILSPATLRKQWDKLTIQMQRHSTTPTRAKQHDDFSTKKYTGTPIADIEWAK